MNNNRPDVQKKIDDQVNKSVMFTNNLQSGEIRMSSPDGSASFVMRNGLIELRVGNHKMTITAEGGKLE